MTLSSGLLTSRRRHHGAGSFGHVSAARHPSLLACVVCRWL